MSAANPTAARPRSVLLVEHDPARAQQLRAALEAGGHAVTHAADAERGLNALYGPAGFDLVVLQLELPGVDGWSFRVAQRREPRIAEVPVIALAEDASPRSAAVDAAAFLPLPVDRGRLLETAAQVLARADDRRTQESVRLGAAVLDSLRAASLDGILLLAPDGRVLSHNARYAELMGRPGADLAGDPVEALLAQALAIAHDPEQVLRGMLTLADPGPRQEREELELRDGRVLEQHATTVVDQAGRHYGRLVVLRDISARKHAEFALRASEHRLRALLGCTGGVLLEFSSTGRYLNVWTDNEALLVRPRESLLGRTVQEILGDAGTAVHEAIERVYRTGRAETLEYALDVQAGQRWFLGDVARAPAPPGGEATVVITARDITERKDIQARLLISERMASVGTLAAGVAAEVNNPLACVLANVESAQESLASAQTSVASLHDAASEGAPVADALALTLRDAQDALSDARQGADRVRQIVRDLRAFARRDVDDSRGPADLRRVLDSALNMVASEVRYRARVVRDYGAAPPVDANEGRLGQVFLNLLLNAAQAIPEGAIERHEVRVRTRTDARGRAEVEIRDTGGGIAPEIRGRIFEPFFTTKPAGAGLGLAICRTIVGALGGEIALETDVGRGSTFRVTLPAARRPATGPHRGTHRGDARRGRVLVIDDEALVGATMSRVLSAEHCVVSTTSPRDALALLERGDRFDVVFCDVAMPEMTGAELRDAIARCAPEQARRVVFLTGDDVPAQRLPAASAPAGATLEKPFDPRSLRALVRDLVR